jgi:hypothetical protein
MTDDEIIDKLVKLILLQVAEGNPRKKQQLAWKRCKWIAANVPDLERQDRLWGLAKVKAEDKAREVFDGD